MSFFRRYFFLIFINILVVTTALILAQILMQIFGIQGEWGFYFVFYSLIGFGGAFVSLYFSKSLAKKFMGVRIIDPRTHVGQERELVDMVHRMASQARLPAKPEVGIYESAQPNAFATGRSKKNSLVAVSRGLLNNMSQKELEGVIAHEVAHIANGDMVTMALLQGLINTMVLLAARFVAKLIAERLNKGYWAEFWIFMGLQIVFGILGAILLNYFSRGREYRADKGGAKLSETENMTLALKALGRLTSGAPAGGFAFSGASSSGGSSKADSYKYLQISGKKARKNSLFFRLLSTHPPLEDRIARLERLSA